LSSSGIGVGAVVKRLRLQRGWTAQRLAEECRREGQVSLTRSTIAKIESGVRKSVTSDELGALASALGVPVSALVYDQGERPSRRTQAGGKWPVRVRGRDGQVRGTGILVSDRFILTSAHLLPADPGTLPRAADRRPAVEFLIDFPLSADSRLLPTTAARDGWIPEIDVAVLELGEPVPDDVRPAEIARWEPGGPAATRLLGFPATRPDGIWADARVMGWGGRGGEWVQLDTAASEYQASNFSGAGVVDEGSGDVIGIVTASGGSGPSDVRAIPVNTVARYWPVMGQLIRPAAGELRYLGGRYRLVYRVSGSVWLAEDTVLQRAVAVKELPLRRGDGNVAAAHSGVLNEARAWAKVRHPAICPVYDVISAGDDLWLVTEYVSGRSLEDAIKDGPLDEQAVAAIALPAVRGLQAAHSANVVHQDLKPANIILADDNAVFLVDLGVAVTSEHPSGGDHGDARGLEFRAPELVRGGRPGPPADLWSLGATLFSALEGHSPFARFRRDQEAMRAAILSDDPPRPAHSGRLADLVLRMLQKDPSERPDCAEVQHVLESITGQQPPAIPVQPDTAVMSLRTPRTAALARSELAETIDLIQGLGAREGAAMLAAMPGSDAALTLANCPPRDASELFQALAIMRPDKAADILRMIAISLSGRIVDYLSPEAAAHVLAEMSGTEAARILNRADLRTAPGVITQLPAKAAAQIIRSMPVGKAAEVLTHIKPATAAGLLMTVPDNMKEALLTQLSPAHRNRIAAYEFPIDT
jgi:transcriptional regulator with XRE-family HTH domain/flagellar motility protein MotE (MotC chaperone)